MSEITAIKWGPDITDEIKATLFADGWIFKHGPLGSYFVSKYHESHPEYKTTPNYLADIEQEKMLARGFEALYESVKSVLEGDSLRALSVINDCHKYFGSPVTTDDKPNYEYGVCKLFDEKFPKNYEAFTRLFKTANLQMKGINIPSNSTLHAPHMEWNKAEGERIRFQMEAEAKKRDEKYQAELHSLNDAEKELVKNGSYQDAERSFLQRVNGKTGRILKQDGSGYDTYIISKSAGDAMNVVNLYRRMMKL